MEAADSSEDCLGASALVNEWWKQLTAAKDCLGVSALVNVWRK